MARDDAESPPSAGPPKVSPIVGKLRRIEQVWQLQGDFHRLPIPVQGESRAEFAIFQTSGELAEDGSELVATVELGCRLTAAVEDTAEIPEEFLDKDDGRAVIAFVRGSYMITYGLNEGGSFSDDEIDEFCAMNGVHTAWPFWREFVTSSLMRSGLEAVPVPPFTIFGPAKTGRRARARQDKAAGLKSTSAGVFGRGPPDGVGRVEGKIRSDRPQEIDAERYACTLLKAIVRDPGSTGSSLDASTKCPSSVHRRTRSFGETSQATECCIESSIHLIPSCICRR